MPSKSLTWFPLFLISMVGATRVVADPGDTGNALPNVVIIYADDQGFGDVSCLNPKAKFETPNLNRLAKEGIAFTNAHSSDTVCTPSRYGLLTGRYCWRTTRKTGVMGAEGPCLIDPKRSTLASLLHRAGYRTAMVGKWHLGMEMPGPFGNRDWTKPVRDMPLDRGFDTFFGIPASLNYGVLAWFDGRHAKVPPRLYTAKKPNSRHVDYRIKPPYQATPEAAKRRLGGKVIEVAEDFVDADCLQRFTDVATQWIDAHVKNNAASRKRQPFFLYVPLTSPHYPVCPRPEFHGQGECGGYGEFMRETDYRVGQVLAQLKESGIDGETLVLFTSDNGPEKSWKQRIDDFGHRSNFHFRGGKRDIYEGGHRVPFLVRWPNGIVTPGRQWSGLVGQTDVYATLAELVGQSVETREAEDSQSFANVLQKAEPKHQRLPLINHGANGRFSITDGAMKLIMPHRSAKSELYDLARDPSEAKNVIATMPDKAKDLREKLTRIVCSGRTTMGPKSPNDTGYWKDLTWLTPAKYAAQAK